MEERSAIWREAANTLNKQSRTAVLLINQSYFFFHNLPAMRWTGHVARMKYRRGAYRVLVGKHEGKRECGRPRRRWEFKY
jgi:hypothetical protein